MHIDGWHIDGFGVFSGYSRRGLGEGLTVFLGPNEAGKSTLLAFLRWVLVGYPPRGAGDNYPPLHGGEHGGRVFLKGCLLYTSDAADDLLCVDLGGRRIIK